MCKHLRNSLGCEERPALAISFQFRRYLPFHVEHLQPAVARPNKCLNNLWFHGFEMSLAKVGLVFRAEIESCFYPTCHPYRALAPSSSISHMGESHCTWLSWLCRANKRPRLLIWSPFGGLWQGACHQLSFSFCRIVTENNRKRIRLKAIIIKYVVQANSTGISWL